MRGNPHLQIVARSHQSLQAELRPLHLSKTALFNTIQLSLTTNSPVKDGNALDGKFVLFKDGKSVVTGQLKIFHRTCNGGRTNYEVAFFSARPNTGARILA